MEYLYVYGAVLVVSIVGMIGAALLFGSHMEEETPQPMNDPIFRREWFDIARRPGVYDPDEVGLPPNIEPLHMQTIDGPIVPLPEPDQIGVYRYVMDQLVEQGLMTVAERRNRYEQLPAPLVPQPVQPVYPGPAALTAEARLYYTMALVDRLMPTLQWTPPTPEQVARQAEEQRRCKEAHEQAQERAEILLLEKLTDEQLIAWRDHRHVEVTGSRTGHTYRIRGVMGHYSMNVDCKENWTTYCAYPGNANETPIQDVILAQMLWITCDEDGFLKQANTSQAFCDRNTDWTRPARPENARVYTDWVPLRIDDTDARYWGVYARGIEFRVDPFRYDMAPGFPYLQEARGVHRAVAQDRRVQPAVRVDRTDHEAWVPDRCIELGCEIRIEPERYGGGRIIDHNGQMAMRLEDTARNYSSREIRRTLERRLHVE